MIGDVSGNRAARGNLMLYATRIMTIDCVDNSKGYQAELIRGDGNGINCITGNVWFKREWAQKEAKEMLSCAADLFESVDETKA